MTEAGGDERPGRRSIERAIEESLAVKIKRVVKSSGSESKVFGSKRMDDSVRNSEYGEKTQLREVLNSAKAGSDLIAIEEEFRVESYQQNDLQGCKGEIGSIDIREGNHVDCVGDTSKGADSNRAQILRSPKRWTLRDLMVLKDKDTGETSSPSAIAVDNNQAMNFCLDISPGFDCQPSTTEEATPRVAEKLNLEKHESELETYILDKLSLLQPSFRTLFEPISVAGTSSTGSSDSKRRQEASAAVKSKWKKKIEDVVAKVYKKQKQQAPDLEAILYETDVKGILKMKWEEEREKSQAKQRTGWPRSCICCPRTNSPKNNLKDWEFQLEEYIFAW